MKPIILLCCILLVNASAFSFNREILYDSIDVIDQCVKFPESATAVLYSTMEVSDGQVHEVGEILEGEDENEQVFKRYPYTYTTQRFDNGLTDVIIARSGTSPTSSFVTRKLHFDQENTLQSFDYSLYRMRPRTSITREYTLLHVENSLKQITCINDEEQYMQDPIHDTLIYNVVHDTIDGTIQTMILEGNKKVLVNMVWDSLDIDSFYDTTKHTIRQMANWNDSLDGWEYDSIYTLTFEDIKHSRSRTIYRDYINRNSGFKRNSVKLHYWSDTLRYVQNLFYSGNGVLTGSAKYSYIYGGETAVIPEGSSVIGGFTASREKDLLNIKGLESNERIAIVNAQGRTLFSTVAGSNGVARISVQQLSSGVHFLVTNKKAIRFVK